jgi:hypothetical protein
LRDDRGGETANTLGESRLKSGIGFSRSENHRAAEMSGGMDGE